jgi:predicted ATP-grasp superfamily ATP-dependent carboligase
MSLTPEDKRELENLLKIAASQIPKYFNLINSTKEKWQIKNIDECIFGMVFEKYIHDSGQYLTNKRIDEGQEDTVENTMESFDAGIEIFNDNVLDIKRRIYEN